MEVFQTVTRTPNVYVIGSPREYRFLCFHCLSRFRPYFVISLRKPIGLTGDPYQYVRRRSKGDHRSVRTPQLGRNGFCHASLFDTHSSAWHDGWRLSVIKKHGTAPPRQEAFSLTPTWGPFIPFTDTLLSGLSSARMFVKPSVFFFVEWVCI